MKKPELTEMIDIFHSFSEELAENRTIYNQAVHDVLIDMRRIVNAYRFHFLTSADNATLWKIRQLAKSFILRQSEVFADLPRIREIVATLENVKEYDAKELENPRIWDFCVLPADYPLLPNTARSFFRMKMPMLSAFFRMRYPPMMCLFIFKKYPLL